MTRLLTFLWIILLLFSCRNKQTIQSVLLNPDKMQAVLWDIIRADAFTTQYIKYKPAKNEFSENALLQKQIFALHKVRKEDFYYSFDYYKVHSSLMRTMLDSMINKAGREKTYGTNPEPVTKFAK